MKNALIIARKETKIFFRSPLAYVIFAVASLANGFFFVIYLGDARVNYLEAVRDLYYTMHGTMMIPCLVVSMFSFSQEQQEGTMELLYTSPLKDTEIVFGKFLFGAVFVLVHLLVLNILYPLLLIFYWDTPLNIIFTGNIGLILIGLSSIAIGIFSSTLTKQYFVAILIALFIGMVLSILGSITPFISKPYKDVLEYLSIYFHYIKFSAGVIALKNVVYFSSLIFFFLFLAVRVVESRRWR